MDDQTCYLIFQAINSSIKSSTNRLHGHRPRGVALEARFRCRSSNVKVGTRGSPLVTRRNAKLSESTPYFSYLPTQYEHALLRGRPEGKADRLLLGASVLVFREFAPRTLPCFPGLVIYPHTVHRVTYPD